MQPGLTTVYPVIATPTEPLTEPQNTSQYGPNASVFGSVDSRPPQPGSETGVGALHGRWSDGGGAASDVSRVPSRSPQRSNSTPPKRNKIAEYEAMGNSVGGGWDAGFIVTKTDWSGKVPADSPVARFPSEVLIHVLSFLEPSTLLTTSLVSRRFHDLVNSPHAWRSAFVRYFPSPHPQLDDHGSPLPAHDQRYFTRLAIGDVNENLWRKEYIQRTRLLRSLNKGKVQYPGISTNTNVGGLMVTYPGSVGPLSVSHLVVKFASTGTRCVHASVETMLVAASDPTTGKIEKHPRRQAEVLGHLPIADLRTVHDDHPDYEVAVDMNVNRVMDMSEELGYIIGENVPDGDCYTHLYPDPNFRPMYENIIRSGGRKMTGAKPLVTAVWIAKKRSNGVRETTDGQASIIIGNSRGIVRVFSILFERNGYNRTAPVADFCICPGIPIVQIRVDEEFTQRRLKQKKPWLLVVNALGEIYYLRRCPPSMATVDDWQMISQTARVPTSVYHDKFPALPKDVSKEESIRSDNEKRTALLEMDYFFIKSFWEDCRMDWFVDVDWAGGNVVLGRTGGTSYWTGVEVQKADIPLRRFHLRSQSNLQNSLLPDVISKGIENVSVFSSQDSSAPSGNITPLAEFPEKEHDFRIEDKWIVSELATLDQSYSQITSYAMDNSTIARVTIDIIVSNQPVPGGNGRFFAIGTNSGSIFVFNIRPTATPDKIETPIRTIHTESFRIPTLAVSSLLVVHGGDDGLVQAWDPLGSSDVPIRTIHSKFSAKARRRMEQETGHHVIDNQFSARALALDPDATSMRGVVALGTLIRYWSFSATLGDGSKKKKKKANKARRTSSTPTRNKGEILEVIEMEAALHKQERARQRREAAELEQRYGIVSGHAALNEEEMLAYARMVSQETFELESSGRSEVGSSLSGRSSETITPEGSIGESKTSPLPKRDHQDDDLELALRLSLQDVEVSESNPAGEVWENPTQFPLDEPGPSNNSSITAQWSSQSPTQSRGKSSSPPVTMNSPLVKNHSWGSPTILDSVDEWPNVSGQPSKGKGKSSSNRGWEKREQEYEDDLELAIRLSLQESKASGS